MFHSKQKSYPGIIKILFLYFSWKTIKVNKINFYYLESDGALRECSQYFRHGFMHWNRIELHQESFKELKFGII